MPTMTIGFGPSTADGTAIAGAGTASLPSASPTFDQAYDSFALAFDGQSIIIGPTNPYYAGVEGLTIAADLTLTWAGAAALAGITSVAITVAAAAASPSPATVAGSVGATPWSWSLTGPGTYTQSLPADTTGAITIGATGQWQVTSIAISYTTQYADGSQIS